MKKIVEDLNWRYAVKQYDADKKLTTEQLDIIKESLRLTPSAYGIQPLKFIFVSSPALREEIKEIAFNQGQVVDASHLLIICSYKSIDESYLDNHVDLVTGIRNTPPERAAGFSEFLKKNILKMPDSTVEPWNVHQAYIALGQLLHTCASIRVDATPMEGFNAKKLDELLGLEEQNLKSVLLCPIGFRSTEDSYQHLTKVRKTSEQLFETI
jgi:nitroreductase